MQSIPMDLDDTELNVEQSTVSIQVPEHLLEQIKSMLKNLTVKEAKKIKNSQKKQDNVKKILNHRNTCRNFQFLVLWKDNVSEWVDDKDCNCETLINEYLRLSNIKTVYLICRVSTKNQDDPNCISLEAQECALLSIIPSVYERVKVIKIKKSSYSNMPSEIVEICKTATGNDAVYFWKIDRFSRNIEKSVEYLKMLEDKKVFVYSLSENLEFSTNKSEFYSYVLKGQQESADISKRIKLTISQKLERGDEKVGKLPYGKKYIRLLNSDGDTVKMKVGDNPLELKVIDNIKRSKTNNKEMASSLNSKGITKHGRKWTPNMIKYIRDKK
jgi:DNA invertase Pin-like site-specific DNA recombinase|uniref:Resolvase/invertase-type recombinase catalytic domain-containing protein n=1 Tax=viral metagenome TaxID=1070528 RepID=A0A6C0IZH0_9ZZZZ